MSVSESDLADLLGSPAMVHGHYLIVSAGCSRIRIEIKLIALSCFFLNV